MIVEEWALFRVTRNADLTLEEDEADDLLEAVEIELRRRRFNKAIRLEVADDISDELLDLLVRELELDLRNVSLHRSPIDLSFLWQLLGLDRPDLKDEPWPPVTAGRLLVRRGRRPLDLRRHPPPGAARAPPVRELHEQRRAVHRAGRRRPPGAVDQDDAVPRRRRQRDHPQPDPGRRARHAGGGARRAQGPLRRGDQRAVGTPARARRRARRVRHGRPEDALARSCSSCATTATGCAATATSAPATTTRRPPASTRTSGSSRATTTSVPTPPSCSTTSPGTAAPTSTARCSSHRATSSSQLIDLIEHEASFGSEGRITLKCNADRRRR